MKQGKNVIYKWCDPGNGRGSWVLTHITFVRAGDRYKFYGDEDIFMATSDPFYKEAIKDYAVNFVKV